MSGMEAGRRYGIDTIIPPVAANTRYVAAGAISIGVEYRLINEEIVQANLNAHGLDTSGPDVRARMIADDGGVSLHVCDTETRTEYLRFDLFDGSPHYHYLAPGDYQINIPYDWFACGDMTSWALRCIRERLPEMLAFCGAQDLAGQVDPAQIEAAMPAVLELVGRSAASV
ncbi:MAG: hypothetical protein JWR06_705 [Jatrophihabitans sp.]|jgi:hypothetical protein|nr:hypothetical protein [Jatrophihabitans sp.]